MANNLTNFLLLVCVLTAISFSTSCSSDVNSTALNDTSANQTQVKAQSLLSRDILLNQPDFTAEQEYLMFETHKSGGFSVSEKLSKKDSIYRWESFGNVTFFRLNQPPVFCSKNGKNCFEKQNYDDCCGYLKANQVENYAKTSDATFELAGSEIVQGYNCIKIKMENAANEETTYFYAAKELKNLVIKTEVIQSDRKHTFVLSNVSFDVPEKLFEPIENFNRKRI